METMKKDKFTYNSVSLYKNNIPINLDIDSICDDLYKCNDNREMFNEIMQGLEKDVMGSDIEKGENDNRLNAFRAKYSNSNSQNEMIGNKSERMFNFKSTVPEGELIEPRPYQPKNIHKKYNDINANSKYYCPSESYSFNDVNKSQWTNRANRIILDSQSNPQMTSNRNYNSNNMTMVSNINSNNKSIVGNQMNNSINLNDMRRSGPFNI